MDTLTDLRKMSTNLAEASAQIELDIEKAKIALKHNRQFQKQIDRMIKFLEVQGKNND